MIVVVVVVVVVVLQNAWYENIYLDQEIRCVRDIRGNYLIVKRV